MSRVLIVDDKEENRYLLRVLLEGHGWQVDEATQGEEALGIARTQTPDLIISDLLMPVMDGYTLLRIWKSDPQLAVTPFVVYTATYTEPSDERLARDLGADAFIIKPTEPEQFLSHLRQLTEGEQVRRLHPPRQPSNAETELLQSFNEVLVRKLEEKSLRLEKSNRELREQIATRKETEDSLRKSELFFRSTIDALALHLAILDEEGRILAVNRAWRDFATANGIAPGFPWEGIDYLRICDDAIGRDRETAHAVATGIRAVMSGKMESYEYEYPCHSPSEQRWFALRATPFAVEGSARVVLTHELITVRKLAEVALVESETRYRAIYENSSEGILLTKPDGSVIAANPQACRIFGCSESEICTAGRDRLVDPSDDRLAPLLREREKTGCARGELRMVRQDGSIFTAELSSALFLDRNDQVAGSIIIRDVTDRIVAEEAVRRSENLLRTVTECISDPIFLKDRNSRILLANPATLEVVGKSREEVLGKSDAEIYDDAELARVLMDNDRLVMETGMAQSIEEQVPGVSGTRVFLSTKSPFRDAQGQVIGVVGTARDITERKRAENLLRLYHGEIAHLTRLNTVGEMAALLAHEISQPLHAISNYAGGIERLLQSHSVWPQSDTLAQAAAGVSREVRRAGAIISRLREFVRNPEVQRTRVDVLHSIDRAVELMTPLAGSKGGSLHPPRQRSGDLPCVLADPIQIEQVIVNLIANAIDAVSDQPATEREVRLLVTISPDAPELEVVVRDTGRGVPAQFRDRLFDPFVSSKREGLGVGLTICRSIVESHGGKIWADHLESHGTAFHFTLPIAPFAKDGPDGA